MLETIPRLEKENQKDVFYDVLSAPEITAASEEATAAGIALMGMYSNFLQMGHEHETPLPIDVLASTRDVQTALNNHGEGSLEHNRALKLQYMDIETLIDEVLTAKKFVLREPIFQSFDYDKRDYYTEGKSHREMVKKGLSPMCNHEEKQIRLIEFAEEEIASIVQEDFERQGLNLISIKECPDWSIDAHSKGESNTGGYVPSENKFVIQSFKFVEGGRIYQQASISGKNISHEDILEVLSDLSGEQVIGDKIDVRKKYFGTSMEIADLIQILDYKATQRIGENIYLGELVNNDQLKDYSNLEKVNDSNRNKKEEIILSVIEMLNSCQDDNIEPLIAANKLDKFISEKVIEYYHDDTRTLEKTFGIETAAKAEFLFSKKLSTVSIISELKVNLPAVEYCGAGSCGIKHVNKSSLSTIRAVSVGLRGEIGFFEEGKCTKCSADGYFVAENGKYCDSCGAKDIK